MAALEVEKDAKLEKMELETAQAITLEELGEDDFLELVGFAHKVDYEGFAYAVSDYPPRFARDSRRYTDDMEVLQVLLDRFQGELAAFWRREDADKAYDAHIDASRQLG